MISIQNYIPFTVKFQYILTNATKKDLKFSLILNFNFSGQALRSQAPAREARVSRLLQGVRQQVQVHPPREREAQGPHQGLLGTMQDLSHLLSG